ncbi:MAG: type III pantothenate kinase, partial [Solirubrobacteraceae bacterium]
MLLVVDVGNTQTHFGTFRDGELVEHWRFATVRESTGDELGAAFASLLELRGQSFDDVDASIVSTVVPELEPEYEAMSARYLGHPTLLVGPGLKTGMPIRIDNPRELGADRLVNSIAAYERFGGPCVVVDFGTSINYDVVSADGEFLGGIIAPGVEISMEALHQRAAKLVRVDLEEPRGVIGKSTIDSVRSGVVYGFAGQVDGI